MNISANIQLYLPYGIWRVEYVFEYVVLKFSLSIAMATNQIQSLNKNDMFIRGLLKGHLCTMFTKYLQWHSNKGQFPFPHYKLIETFKLP